MRLYQYENVANAEFGLRIAESFQCGMRNAECGMQPVSVATGAYRNPPTPDFKFRNSSHSAIRNPNSAFTLTELLVVITIIAILSSLITAAALSAMKRAKQARITMEIQQISTALENFKTEYNAYPPNGVQNNDYFESSNDFVRMFKKAFPRHRESEALIRGLAGDTKYGNPVLQGGMNGAEAIFFWLGGFSKDPKFPISGPGGPSFISVNPEDLASRSPTFEFDLGRLGPRDQNGLFNGSGSIARSVTYLSPNPNDPKNTNRQINLWLYFPKGSEQPYGYFDTSRHRAQVKVKNAYVNNYDPWGGDTGNSIFMYAIKARNETDRNRIEFANQGKFQVLHCGLDDVWGNGEIFYIGTKGASAKPVTLFPEGPFIGDIADTLTNFTTGTLEDAQE